MLKTRIAATLPLLQRLVSILKSTRFWGLIGTGVVLWFLAFVVLGNLDMSWIMPDTNRIARNLIRDWPQMPFFNVEREPASNTDGGEYVTYTVPTKIFTRQELEQMGVTNATAHPSPPK